MIEGLFSGGSENSAESSKYIQLTLIFFNVIGSYWLLRPLKSGVFYILVGNAYLPTAKLLSFVLMVPLILIYGKLVDIFPRQKLIYIICSFYGLFFLVSTVGLMTPGIGIPGRTHADPSNFLGWAIFLAIESFGSIVVSLFWSFVSSSTTTASAKKGYGWIVLGGQIGSIIGPSLATAAESIGITLLFSVAIVQIFLVILQTRIYMKVVGEREDRASTSGAGSSSLSSSKQTGPLAGLKLLLAEPYLLGIFGVSTIYEIIATILDFQMKMLSEVEYPNTEDYISFNALFGVCTNVSSLLIALVGTSTLLQKIGLRACLILFPLTVLLVLVYTLLYPSLTVVFWGQVVLKSISYAVNNPAKEILYLPTSPDVKFKVKSWVDMFGGRSAKALGATVLERLKGSLDSLMYSGTTISILIVGLWLSVAIYTGNKYLALSGEKSLEPAVPAKKNEKDVEGGKRQTSSLLIEEDQ